MLRHIVTLNNLHEIIYGTSSVCTSSQLQLAQLKMTDQAEPVGCTFSIEETQNAQT